MVVDRADSVTQIATLLESQRLTDPAVVDVQSWHDVIRPLTRPFLERIRDALREDRVRFFQPAGVKTKRSFLDNLSIRIGDIAAVVAEGRGNVSAFVTIGGAVPEDGTAGTLSWGLSWWGRAVFTDRVADWFRTVAADEPAFSVDVIDTQQTGDIGGWFVLLQRTLSPTELRERDENEIVLEIAADLDRLVKRASDDLRDSSSVVAPAPSGPLSAETLSSWLRSARGLSFTPYQIAAFVTALQAKGFIILSGLSGTGKTQLAVRIAELVQGVPPNVIPVRPDWRDSRSLLGHYNPISERYASTELLRQLLPEQEAEPELPTTFDVGRVRQSIAAERDGWLQDLRALVERFERVDATKLASSDLHRIWRETRNGVASIGQAVSNRLVGDEDELREVTGILAGSGTPGEKLIAALGALRNLGNPWHWARTLRVLALFDLDRTSTIVDRHALRAVLAALGYDRTFRLKQIVQRQDAAAVDAGFAFLRRRIDELFDDFDRFQKAVAPWFIYEQLTGGMQTHPVGSEPTTARPRFVILDEMNLARVEYYFAEFLSVLESDRDDAGVTTQALPLHAEQGVVRDGPAEDPSANEIPSDLRLPPYLYVVGTVNTDETTHAFSPKVLDRAFTLEFNDVDLARTGGRSPEGGRPALAEELVSLLAGSSPHAGRDAMERAMADARFLDWLGALYSRLRPYDLHFGFRARDEIARFVGFAAESPLAGGFAWQAEDVFVGAFDAAVLMKVLPKFHGPRAKLSAPLTWVLSWAIAPEEPDEARSRIDSAVGAAGAGTGEALLRSALGAERSEPTLPRVADKAARMLHEVTTVGFTAFS